MLKKLSWVYILGMLGLLVGCASDEFLDLNDVPTIPLEKINADDANRPTIIIQQD